MESPTIHRALILAQSIGQAEHLQRHLAGKPYKDIEFRYPATISHQIQDLQTVYKDSCNTIEEEDIDVVINVDPGLNFVQAALAQTYAHLLTPTAESLVLCCHSYYNKLKISHDFCEKYWLLDFEDDVIQQLEKTFIDTEASYLLFNGAFKNVQPPRKIRDQKGFLRELDIIQRRMRTEDKLLRFLKGRIVEDGLYYALHRSGVFHVDPAVDNDRSTSHMVEMCVSDGSIVPWVISDLHFWKCNRNIPKDTSIPTRLNENIQYDIWATMRIVVQRLIHTGFDNHFVNAKIVVQNDSNVKIMDMESSIIKENTLMYRHVYTNGDNLGALIDLGLHRLMDHPKVLPTRAAVRAQLIIFRSDPTPVNICDVANITYAKHDPKVFLHVHEQSMIIHDKRRGYHLADVLALGTTVPECEEIVEKICKKILKDERSSHWSHCLHK